MTAVQRGCKGWNYHVWSLCSDRCTMCGMSREEARNRPVPVPLNTVRISRREML